MVVYSCICCLRAAEARNTAEFVAKVLFCHKQGRNISVGGLRTSWAVPPFISCLCICAFCALQICFLCFIM
jgi:hypothetical protein